MHITGMTIQGIPPFTEKVEFKFDERVNLFIGPNAAGKSTILRILQSRTEIDGRFAFQLSEDWSQNPMMTFYTRRTRLDARSSDGQKEGSDLVPWLYFPPARLNLPLSYDADAMHGLQQSASSVVFVFDGEEETLNPFDSMRRSLSRYYFDGRIIQKYCKGVADLFRAGKSSHNTIILNQTAKRVAYQCAQHICSDILNCGDEPQNYIYQQPAGDEGLFIPNIHDDMGVITADGIDEPLFMGDLSSGTQGTLLWVWYLAIEMANFRNHRGDWQTQPVILLIDEIENHLHPTWQRRVIPALLEHFPGLQIFATTHSPFVVAGLKAGQVHLLNRDANGVITATTNEQDIIGWTTDEILRTFMGVDDPTDDATATAARKLRELRDEGLRAPAGAEEERQAEMQELRRLVDRDLLAGGPMARRREEFAQRFREAMERRQQAEELNQDNG